LCWRAGHSRAKAAAVVLGCKEFIWRQWVWPRHGRRARRRLAGMVAAGGATAARALGVRSTPFHLQPSCPGRGRAPRSTDAPHSGPRPPPSASRSPPPLDRAPSLSTPSRRAAHQDITFVANDWHGSLVPVYLAGKYRPHGVYTNSRSILAIHNLRHQVRRHGGARASTRAGLRSGARGVCGRAASNGAWAQRRGGRRAGGVDRAARGCALRLREGDVAASCADSGQSAVEEP
jgi:hypothetical protein